jgi:uncharacterized membrane protein YccC
MIAADIDAAVFSAKTFAGAMVAYYVSLRVGLSQPVWSITTVYILSQPLAGAVLSKAVFRLLGTLLGGTAAVVFVPAFVNEPLVLSFVLSLWVGLCAYVAQLDRTPRSYVFLLAGYTAGIIGFPSVLAPDGIFNTAIERVQEIGIGIAAASLVHGAIWPRTVTTRLKYRIAATVHDAERWSRSALAGSRDAALDRERRRLAVDVNEIEQLFVHLPFDTERLIPRGRLIRALQDQISWLLPLSGVIEDRIAECAAQAGGLPPEVTELLARVEAWLDAGGSGRAQDEIARRLVADAGKLDAGIATEARVGWREMLLLSLLARLPEFVAAHRALRELREQVNENGQQGLSPETAALVAAAAGRSFHRDYGLALRSAVGTSVGVYAVCIFWIFTAWPSGWAAAEWAAVSCALFVAFAAPGIEIRRFLVGTIIGVAAAAVCGFVLFPRVTDFTVLVLAMGPLLLIFGGMLARPALALLGLGAYLGFTTVGLTATYQSDFSAFINGAIAQIAGVGVSILFVDAFQVISTDAALSRLLRAGFRDIAARAEGRARDTRRWTSRMIDRAALITARAASAPAKAVLPTHDVLAGLRIGYAAGELRALVPSLTGDEERRAVALTLRGVGEHFRRITSAKGTEAGQPVLRAIDRALLALAADPQPEQRRNGLVLLTGLRRGLFPHADGLAGPRA